MEQRDRDCHQIEPAMASVQGVRHIELYNNLALAKFLMASVRRGPDRICTLAEAGLIDCSQDSSFFREKSRNS